MTEKRFSWIQEWDTILVYQDGEIKEYVIK